MFDFDAGKLLIIGIVALIFIPSKDLPRVLRQLGQFVGKMRRMAGEFQGQFMDAMREADMAELRREATQMAKSAEVDMGLDPVHELNTHLRGLIEGKPSLSRQDATALGEASEAATRDVKTIAPPDLASHGEAGASFVEATHPVDGTHDATQTVELTPAPHGV